MKWLRYLVISSLAAFLWVADMAPAAAAEGDEAAAAEKGDKKKGKKKKGGIIVLDAIKVEGRIQKPQAFYILQRTNLNFTSLELKKSFLKHVEESVLKAPF